LIILIFVYVAAV